MSDTVKHARARVSAMMIAPPSGLASSQTAARDFVAALDELEKKLAAAKAEAVHRGRMLLVTRDKLINIEIEDEGDRAYLASTNDADALKEASKDLDDFKWSEIMAEKDEPDIYDQCRAANQRAEFATAEVDILRGMLGALIELIGGLVDNLDLSTHPAMKRLKDLLDKTRGTLEQRRATAAAAKAGAPS